MTVIQTPLATDIESAQRSIQPGAELENDGDVVLELRAVTKAYLRKKGAPTLPAVTTLSSARA